jgi:hypothetical protein
MSVEDAFPAGIQNEVRGNKESTVQQKEDKKEKEEKAVPGRTVPRRIGGSGAAFAAAATSAKTSRARIPRDPDDWPFARDFA